MTTVEQLERNLSAWFGETAVRDTPEFAQDILMRTGGVRQRPRWTFLPPLPRPMGRSLRSRTAPGALRALTILVVIGAIVALAIGTLLVSSGPRVPAPFGRAANGLVAYEKDGDIYVVDPETGQRSALVAGPEQDAHPRWSLDGTRLAFIRTTNKGERLVVVNAAGQELAVSQAAILDGVDPDGIQWSPSGRDIVVKTNTGTVFLIETTSGQQRVLPIVPWGLEVFWRPPDGRELLFLGGLIQQPALYRYAVDTGAITEVPGTGRPPAGGRIQLRPIGFTPDGSRFAYHRTAPTDIGFETAVVDVETGVETTIDVAYGRMSNDGTRIVGFTGAGRREWICVAPVDGGSCVRISGHVDLVDWSGWSSFQWTPDDRWIWSRPAESGAALLLDPNGGGAEWPPWAAEGADSWQRRAP